MIRITDDFYCTAQEFGGIRKDFNHLIVYACGQEILIWQEWEYEFDKIFDMKDKEKAQEAYEKFQEKRGISPRVARTQPELWREMTNSEFNRILAEYEKERNDNR